jgi:Na+-translocating ferredoxin:NAD+ oxidoreductase subunit G
VFDGKVNTVTFETSGKGYGGDIGVMVGVNLDDDKIVGVGVTTHSETPGIGSKAKTDAAFSAQFKGMPLKDTFKVKTEGGQVDSLSGATITSRGVSAALTDAGKIYENLKPQIADQLKSFTN